MCDVSAINIYCETDVVVECKSLRGHEKAVYTLSSRQNKLVVALRTYNNILNTK